jgi:hypothetical protein
VCHSPDMVRTFRRSAADWQDLVVTMNDQGAKVTDEQMPILVEYLTRNWGPRTSSATAASSAPGSEAGAAISSAPSVAQPADMPAEYRQVLNALALQGDFRDGVLKVNVPRSDLKVTIEGIATPTTFGFVGWVALQKGSGDAHVMMGDLVLTESEVNPVMSALLDGGLDVTAVHNHFFFESPRIFYMHVHGHGTPAELASKLKPALALIGNGAAPSGPAGRALQGALDTARLAAVVGTPGDMNAGVYKITIGRPDIKLTEMGAPINARMGLNTWAAFYGSDADAVVAGDVAMLETEVQPVLKALRHTGIDVVAIHQHMSATNPSVTFLHYWGRGHAQTLAAAIRAALDVLAKDAR